MKNLKVIILTFYILCSMFCVNTSAQKVIVLGVAQDAGYPQMGCEKECCNKAWKDDSLKCYVVSLAFIDPASKKWWLFEATPDIKEQLQYFKTLTKGEYPYLPSGVFLTHAHIGHYTGLMELGREVMNAKEIPVYTLPKMKMFLENNGPWSQLVKLKNISLVQLDTAQAVYLEKGLFVSSFTVPHRDEFSETAGFKIISTKASYLFIPDIDKWQKWERSIISEVKKVSYAFVDATFSDANELQNRKMEEVPHPFIAETMDLFRNESREQKGKIHFIHFNHTNPVMHDKTAREKILKQGFRMAEQGGKY